ncbi:hypothetical protein [Anaerobacillus alkalilacustris]|nr:hypothetical protein [Anaerobacillus alkalilacustris]
MKILPLSCMNEEAADDTAASMKSFLEYDYYTIISKVKTREMELI